MEHENGTENDFEFMENTTIPFIEEGLDINLLKFNMTQPPQQVLFLFKEIIL